MTPAHETDTSEETEIAHALAALLADEDSATGGLPSLDAIVGAAAAARPTGQPTGPWQHPEAEPVAALATTIAEFGAVLARLSPQDWNKPTPTADPTWRVRDLVAHVVAVDRYHQALLGGTAWHPAPGTETDHLAMTEAVVAELSQLSVAALWSTWQETSAALLALCEAERAAGRLDVSLTFTGLPLRLRSLLIVRVFEIWTHSDDVRAAVGAPLVAPDPGRLSVMSALAVRSLPLGLALAGLPGSGRTVRLVLTGPGGGAWSQSLDLTQVAGEPDVVIVADVVAFCRLAARRLRPAELDLAVSGDESLVPDLLIGAAIFAA